MVGQRDEERTSRRHCGSVKGDVRRYELTSREVASRELHLEVLDELTCLGRIDEPTRLRIELAFQEALTNSLEHGNLELVSDWKEEFDSAGVDRYSKVKSERLDDAQYALRRIFIEARCEAETLVITIEDEGKGFSVGDGPVSKDIVSYGRGLKLISSNVDEVMYLKSGREIRMLKKL